jgi:hypothetical protein
MLHLFSLSTLLLLAMTHASRYYCYKGSSLYQVEYVDCGDLSSGDWYCSKITVCENDIDSERECIETRYGNILCSLNTNTYFSRGCATQTECTNPRTGSIFNGERVFLNSSYQPAGMKIAVECCKANKFADDDALAIDMSEICNSSSRVVAGVASTVAGFIVALIVAFNY